MAPPPAPTQTTSPGPRASLGGPATRTTTKPTPSAARQSLSGSRLSLGPTAAPQQPRRTARSPEHEEQTKSPTIEEEEPEDDVPSIDSKVQEAERIEPKVPDPPDAEPTSPTFSRARATSNPRNTAANVESRTADKRENEQLKAKIRTLEKKAIENRDKIKTIDVLQNDKDRYETIIQTLQKKLKANQQEMTELKSKYHEAEKRAGEDQGRSAEHESEIELATLDKEMAEERAEMYHAELEALKVKHEELELEVDIIKEENRELGSVMSPEDRANAGWLQMEKEQERLRQALVLLRDISQQSESQLRSEVKELQDTVDELEGTTSKYNEVSEKLARSESTNKHLMEQLEVAEANDDVVVAMEAQREQSLLTIEQLRKQVQDFEEHIQVTEELESFHVEEEKRLHYQLDESDAMLNEKNRQTTEQEKVIGDLEYTLTKFRDAVQGLQSDIDELRRSRDISELEAHEMSSKSRAMMDLNLQLQNTASKTQLKTIDYEMGRMHAEQAKSHLEIMQLFVPDSFDVDRYPILALLCFKRIRSKAALTRALLAERMRDRPHLLQADPFMVFEVMEKLSLITTLCDRSTHFMSTCSTQEFGKFSGALYELEPVERSMTGWVEALKLDELGSDGPEFLQRMIGILQDMGEKLTTESRGIKANELVAQSSMVERYAESTAHQLNLIVNAVQSRLGRPSGEDEESQVFDNKMDQFGTRARTIKYLGGKVTQLLLDLRSRSMCLGEPAWGFFDEAETAAGKIAAMVRAIGKAVLSQLGKLEHEEPLTYASIIDLMTATGQVILQEQDARATMPDGILTFLASQLHVLQSKVDDLQTKAADINSATEYETPPAPWTVRAKQIKAQKIISQDTQEQLTKLTARAQEQALQLAEKDKMIEEQKIRVELLESRSKESKAKEADVNALDAMVQKIEREKREVVANLERMKAEYNELVQKRDAEKAELEALKNATTAEGGDASASGLGDSSETTQLFKTQVEIMQTELLSLQAAVRYLKSENQALRVPVGELALYAERNAWLRAENLGSKHARCSEKQKERERLKREGEHVLEGLIELAGSLKPVRLRERDKQEEKGWKKMEQTTRWHVAKQREEVERWVEWREEVVRRAKMEMRVRGTGGKAHIQAESALPLPSSTEESGWEKALPGSFAGGMKQVRIVESSP